MSVVFAAVMIGLALVVLLTLGAVVELFRDVQDIRVILGASDHEVSVDIGALQHRTLESFGIPNAPGLELILFLSEKCATCRQIAIDTGENVPDNLLVVVQCKTEGADWSTVILPVRERVLVDAGGHLGDRLGINMSPLVLRVYEGAIQSGFSVANLQQVLESQATHGGTRGSAPALRFVPTS